MQLGKFSLDLITPKIMGVLNITHDSFSDGGKYINPDCAIERAKIMQAQGADIIDIGGESSRPGAKPVTANDELNRVIPVIEALANKLTIPISIDTIKPQVIEASIKAGANMVNDISALVNPESLELVSKLNVPVCLMHMQGKPQTMQEDPHYQNVVADVFQYFKNKIAICLNAGIKLENIIIDPGFGFGKTLQHNIALLKNLAQFTKLNVPILVGISKKSMVGQILDLPNPESRVIGSLIAHTIATQNGAKIIRTHDVIATREMLSMLKSFG